MGLSWKLRSTEKVCLLILKYFVENLSGYKQKSGNMSVTDVAVDDKNSGNLVCSILEYPTVHR